MVLDLPGGRVQLMAFHGIDVPIANQAQCFLLLKVSAQIVFGLITGKEHNNDGVFWYSGQNDVRE